MLLLSAFQSLSTRASSSDPTNKSLFFFFCMTPNKQNEPALTLALCTVRCAKQVCADITNNNGLPSVTRMRWKFRSELGHLDLKLRCFF